MSDRVFLDSNILVYARDDRDPRKQRIAWDLIVHHAEAQTGVISYQVIQEFFNVVFGKAARKMTHVDAQETLTDVLQPLLAVHSSVALFSEAIRIQERYRLSWYDSLIVAAALQGGCRILYSEDLQHGQQIGSLTIQDPFR